MINLDRCNGNCNTLDDPSNKIYIPNKTEDVSLIVFNMIAGINDSKAFIKHKLYECKYKNDVKKSNLNQKWNNDKSWCGSKNQKKNTCVKKIIFGILVLVLVKIASFIDDSVIASDEIIEATKNISTKAVLTKIISTKTDRTKSTSTNSYNLLSVSRYQNIIGNS